MPSLVWINVRRLESIVETIDRATLISMQPRAMASKRDQIGGRNIGVVPHERTRLISCSALSHQVTRLATRSLPLLVLTSSPPRRDERSGYCPAFPADG